MFHIDGSSASSPFSTVSTDASSPETGQTDAKSNGQAALYQYHQMQSQQHHSPGVPNFFANYNANGKMQPSPTNFPRQTSPPQPQPPSSFNFDMNALASRPSETPSLVPAAETSTHQGGTRSEPPKRKVEVEGLPVVATRVEDLAKHPGMNRLLLQGDPQVITKQRVETAIRVILDLLRLIPASPSDPPLDPALAPLLLRDPHGNILTSLERIGTFRSIKLQAGTTTKASSKKQLQAGPTPRDQLLYLETAVYMSGDNGKRVYACKRCRMREAKRRQNKDASRKKPAGNEFASPGKPPVSAAMPNQDYITGSNADQYDPIKNGQRVEEPHWDPMTPDWRHEIVLFNSPPEVIVKDGSCVWLPFRVVCYGKCHGEKQGFRVKFTLRAYTGDIIATGITGPIRITDDHKTDAKTKPKTEGNVARPRKARPSASVASSRRVSPSPSDAESIQSVSEAGAVVQKQTPSVRAGKPYDRPPSHSPLTGTLPMDSTFPNALPVDTSSYRRTPSMTSMTPLGGLSLSNMSQNDIMSQPSDFGQGMFDGTPNGTVSPGVLRQPAFDFGTFTRGASNPPSGTSSNVASPLSNTRSLEHDPLLFGGDISSPNRLSAFGSLHDLEQQQRHRNTVPPPMMGYQGSADMEMSNAISSSLDNIFDTSSHASVASSYNDEASFFSNNLPEGSLFSDSGVVPEDMQGFLDFTGGEGDTQPVQPNFYNESAPPVPMSPQAQEAQDRQLNSILAILAQHEQSQQQSAPPLHPTYNANPLPDLNLGNSSVAIDQLLARLVQAQAQSQRMASPVSRPPANPPTISKVFPAEGLVAGGTAVAILGSNFAPGVVILFGDRTATIQRVESGYIECIIPPAATPGVVEVNIADVTRSPGTPPVLFNYITMEMQLMRLALQVDQHGSASNPAYQLAQQLQTGSSSPAAPSESKGNNSRFPKSGNQHRDMESSPTQEADDGKDNQTLVADFISAIETKNPGSLRRFGSINLVNSNGHTLLHMATAMGYDVLAGRLVRLGADVDLEDANGYTALALASLMGQSSTARVLVEAGAAYDRPTSFGELPLDLAKLGEHAEVEALLLSAVWSTKIGSQSKVFDQDDGISIASGSVDSIDMTSEIDEDNPSDGSDDEESVNGMTKPRRQLSRRVRSKQKSMSSAFGPRSMQPRSRRASLALPLHSAPPSTVPIDAPPPYDAHPQPPRTSRPPEALGGTWMSRTISTPSTIKFPLPDMVWDRLPVPVHNLLADNKDNGWVAFPAPTWDTITKMTSPEEVKMFTQAMAAAAMNAVIQSGATTTVNQITGTSLSSGFKKKPKSRRKSGDSGNMSSESGAGSPTRKIGEHVKSDRMLYLFWLPILLFVGFWLVVTALPLATGFCLIYARQITRAIKQRI